MVAKIMICRTASGAVFAYGNPSTRLRIFSYTIWHILGTAQDFQSFGTAQDFQSFGTAQDFQSAISVYPRRKRRGIVDKNKLFPALRK